MNNTRDGLLYIGKFGRIGLLTGLLAASLGSVTAASGAAPVQESSISGPILGFVTDHGGAAIRPILGVPGAAIMGDHLAPGADVRNLAISPRQDYALGVRNEDAQMVIIPLGENPAAMTAIPGGLAASDTIVISPGGTGAALYSDSSKYLQLIRGLPAAGEVTYEFDLTGIGFRPSSIAVSDDGTLALLNFADSAGSTLWVADAAGSLWSVPATRPSSVAFFPNSRNAVVANNDEREVYLLLGVDKAATRVPLVSAMDGLSGYSGVAASSDGRRVFVTGSESENVAVVDVETRTYTVLPCHCRPTGLRALNGGSVFQLERAEDGPLVALDASNPEPRIVVVPPSVRASDASPQPPDSQ